MSNDEARMRELMRELGYYNMTGPVDGAGMNKKQAKAYVKKKLAGKQLKNCRELEAKIDAAKLIYQKKKPAKQKKAMPALPALPKKKLNAWQKFVKKYKGTGLSMAELSKEYQDQKEAKEKAKKAKGKKLKGSSLVDYYGSSLVDYDF